MNYATSVSIPLCWLMAGRKQPMSRALFLSRERTREEKPRVRFLAMTSGALFQQGYLLASLYR